MTPKERFARVLDLYAFAEAQQRANIARAFPDEDEAAREKRLRAWKLDKPMMSGTDLRVRPPG